MLHWLKRTLVRPAALVLVVGGVVGLGSLGVETRTKSAHAQVADPGRAQAIIDFLNDRNAGDFGAAAALFTDDAFFALNTPFGDCSFHTPCFGRAAILQDLQTVDAAQTNRCYTVTSIEVMGSIVTGRIEVRHDVLRARGIERIYLGFLAQVADGQILSFYVRPDLADPQTALNQAINAGAAQPTGPALPTPNPVCG